MLKQPIDFKSPDARASRRHADSGVFPVSYQPAGGGIFQIRLWGPIESPLQFTEAIEAMEAATEADLVIINLSTPGGDLDATDTFLQAMRECQGRIIVRATGGVHSAGTLILLAADEFVLSENFNCLIHNGEIGFGGKFSDWKTAVKHSAEYMERVMRNTYKGFLTDDEIEECLRGRDFWLTAEEFVERWEKREALRNEEEDTE